MHYYKFNIGDWHLHTSHLTLVEEAVYFRLVNHYYNTEKPFKKSETQTLIRRLRLGNESVTVDQVLAEFFTLTGENYVHARCEKEIKSFRKKAKVNKSNGAKGGRPRIDKGTEDIPEETQTVTTTNPDETLNTNHKPLTTNQEPPLSNMVADAPVNKVTELMFEDFWLSGMARVGGKAKTLAAINTKLKNNPNLEALTFIRFLITDVEQRLKAGQYGFDKLHPFRYIRDERYNDDIQTNTPVNNPDLSSTNWGGDRVFDKTYLER